MAYRTSNYRPPPRLERSARGYPAVRGQPMAAPPPRASARSRDLYRGLILAGSLALLVACIVAGGYGVKSQLNALNDRNARQAARIAAATSAGLREGPVLFVPEYGNVCKRRWIDNGNWMLRDGEDIVCDEAVSWNSTVPVPEHSVGQRMDAVRSGFRTKSQNLE